jgi:hypothetical protein
VDRAHGPVVQWPDFGSRSTVDHGQEQWSELAGGPTAWEVRGGDGDLYPGWHKMTKGLRQPCDGGPRWRPEFLD